MKPEIDHWDEIEERQAVEEQPAVIVVRAAEYDVTGLDGVPAIRVAHPGFLGHDLDAEPKLRHRPRHDLDLGSHRVRIGLPCAVQAIQVGDIDDIVVDEKQMPDAQSRQ